MANEIYGFKVDGVIYEYDFKHLANNPIPAAGVSDNGKVLAAGANGVLEWEEISGVPQSYPTDEGKVLTVYYNGAPVWEEAPSGGLPYCSDSDVGKILVVVGNDAVAWEEAPSGGLPYCSESDEGKTLIVQSNGEPVWAELLPAVSCDDNGKVLIAGGCDSPYSWGSAFPEYSGSGTAFLSTDDCGEFRWENIPVIPECTSEDTGKILMVGESGMPIWADLQ